MILRAKMSAILARTQNISGGLSLALIPELLSAARACAQTKLARVLSGAQLGGAHYSFCSTL